MLRSSIFGMALLPGFVIPAFAADPYQPVAPVEAAPPPHKLVISGNVDLTTDYVYRGFSQTDENPALQGEVDLTYNIFYFGIWGSNLNFGEAVTSSGKVTDVAQLELDWYGGIRPVWGKWNFDFGALYYTYPNAFDPGGDFNYVEVKTGISHTFFDKFALSLTNYYSPDNSGGVGRNDVLELGAGYSFNKVWYFTPTVSGVYGRQWGDTDAGGISYSYWNASLGLAFWDKPAMTLDLRYWDTNAGNCSDQPGFQCDDHYVATLKAAF